MSRDYLLPLEDIREAIDRISRHTHGLTPETLAAEEIRVDAVIRNLELLSEAVEHLPDDTRAQAPHISGPQVAGLRDVVAHAYFSVNLTSISDTITNELGPLRSAVQAISESSAPPPSNPADSTPPTA
jgi:uncharacterized protein with HEPN domain